VAKRVRAGMNKDQFESDKNQKNEDDMEDFFDCKIVENLDENKGNVPAIMASDPADELKMDKDLGLFEFIQKGDFSTVAGGSAAAAASASAAAAASNPGAKAQQSTFDFDNFDASNQEPSKGQNAQDFFNFDAPQSNNQQQDSAAAQSNKMEDQLADIFSNIPSQQNDN